MKLWGKPGSENSPWDLPYDFKNSEIDICTRIFNFVRINSTQLVIALFVWAPQPISRFYIVLAKSAMRLINSKKLPIKKRYIVYVYAWFKGWCSRRFYRVPVLKTPPYGKCGQNRKMVWHFYGKTKTAITSSKNQFRPQFWAQIVAGVETHPYSLFLGPGGHFWQSYEENRGQKFSAGIYHTILKKVKSTFVPGLPILPNEQYHNFCLLTSALVKCSD